MTEEEIRTEDDRLITVDVARAVEERELIAYYQPIVNIATRRVVSAEALVRWTMPDGTIVPAALFVPSLERTNTICGLDWYMAEEVSAFLSESASTPAQVPTSLNFSVRHAQDPDFSTKLAATAEWHDVAPHLIRVEYNAQAYLQADDALKTLHNALFEHGFVLTADNFSQGVDGLRRLADAGVRVVKLASAYWRAADEAELGAVIDTANGYGVVVSAEGVEDESELAKLNACGYVFGQGYYFAKPMDRTSFEAFCA